MIKEVIAAYYKIFNKSKLKLRERFSGDENFFRQEVAYYDDGRIASGIARMQEDYAKIVREIKSIESSNTQEADRKQQLDYLYRRQYDMIRLMSFQGSQNIKNIRSCIQIWGDIKDDFRLCLDGIMAHAEGETGNAYELLTTYLEKHRAFGEHYLLNKLYGEMLMMRGREAEAEVFFYRVTQICPDDVEIHKKLSDIYEHQGKKRAAETERQIAYLLMEEVE